MPSVFQPLLHLLEVSIADSESRNFTGTIQDPNKMFTPEVASNLESLHSGVFAFLVFHPHIDKDVVTYMETNAIGEEAGSDILVLLTLEVPLYRRQRLTTQLIAQEVAVDTNLHPSYEFARNVHAPESPIFPGIIFFHRLSQPSEPVYIQLRSGAGAPGIRDHLKELFSLANEAHLKSIESGELFQNFFCRNLALKDHTYIRRAPLSIIEILARSFHATRRHLSHISAAVDVFKK